ncbi:YbgC/FadM family acyl-CoA thioesterase [Erythrobacter sp. 3-20A1M]|uniref:YbgC/FadM family acyl-CoA thioesterase n=1 Tax=Erythrobacter sp. 3-20A1M TaxID=2653850 RepID=UPI001BFC947E|nr:YbgC/FadM family acyl-CoA thioesterase [Erythrobacter sp. 3-20A1M]QWC56534.1 YbgC/FadM family acyl-CoA thioesterase [Erythrobacter sp. 3-20A1M]
MSIQPHPPGGVFDGPRHLYAVRVYYEDTDLSGITYHANYLRWFERARSDVLRMLGIDQRAAIEAGGGAYAVADLSMRYLRPAKLDDDVVIETRCTQIRAASVRMAQRALRGDETLCEANFRVGFVAPDGRPCRQPPEWVAAFQSVLSEDDS